MSTLDKIAIEVSVVLGSTTMPVHQLLRMGRGAMIELDAFEGDGVELLANDIPIARGEVMLKGDRVGVAITEVRLRSPALRRQGTHKAE